MLDPVKSAKIIGFLLIVGGALTLLVNVMTIGSYETLDALILLGLSVGLLSVGIGLRKSKLWGIYGLGVLALIYLLLIIMDGVDTSSAIYLIILCALFGWFYSEKKRFSK